MKKVLITGGATGIGKATAMLFAQKGYDVFVTYNQTEPDFDNVTKIKCNLENEEDILNLFEKVKNIDILVNNAGISLIKQINDTTAEEYDKIMSVNARSYFLCSREAVKLMLKKHEGAIVNVSSMWGQTGASCEIAYSMSKAAVIGLTRSLAEELAPSKITVNCVCPGIIDTRMNGMFDKKELEEEVPLGRLGTSEEVAEAIYYLTQNKYITAQILGVNGGII
ncbi:MAG: SDR family oxidoreductase [Eubacterium sp.]|nr:SDR family oxidoreductase [Eubacterium sp.]MDD6567514.1 SDR family oxidoreductase [Eubacteriales bacterium]MDY4111088.1 SDR family oxidoreductase [Eubacterium sp.]